MFLDLVLYFYLFFFIFLYLFTFIFVICISLFACISYLLIFIYSDISPFFVLPLFTFYQLAYFFTFYSLSYFFLLSLFRSFVLSPLLYLLAYLFFLSVFRSLTLALLSCIFLPSSSFYLPSFVLLHFLFDLSTCFINHLLMHLFISLSFPLIKCVDAWQRSIRGEERNAGRAQDI